MVAKSVSYGKKKRKSGVSPLFGAAIFFLIVGAIVSGLLYTNIRMAQKRAELEETVASLQDQAAFLQERTEELKQGVELRQTEEFQEKVLREQGLYKKEGEEVFTIVRPEDIEIELETDDGRVWWNPLTW